MFSLYSRLISRRILNSIHFNCIKTFQTNGYKLQKTLNSKPFIENRFKTVVNNLEKSLKKTGKISFNQINECIEVLSKCKHLFI